MNLGLSLRNYCHIGRRCLRKITFQTRHTLFWSGRYLISSVRFLWQCNNNSWQAFDREELVKHFACALFQCAQYRTLCSVACSNFVILRTALTMTDPDFCLICQICTLLWFHVASIPFSLLSYKCHCIVFSARLVFGCTRCRFSHVFLNLQYGVFALRNLAEVWCILAKDYCLDESYRWFVV